MIHRDRKDAESLLNKHRTKYCSFAHRAACQPNDPNSEYQVGARVCKLTEVNQADRQIWCVVATAKGSRCFKFAPNSRGDDEPDTCIVVAPFSDIEKGHVESREHWRVKYDQSLFTKAPTYNCGGTVRISVNGRLENHVIQECDWTYNDLYTGWIYRIEEAEHGWMTERFLDGAIKRALIPVNPVKTEVHDTAIESAQRSSKSKTSKNKQKKPKEDDSKEAELREQMRDLRKQLREQQSARLKEQMTNNNLKTKVKALKQELTMVKADAEEALEEAQEEAKQMRREVKRKYRALLKKAQRTKREMDSESDTDGD